MKGYFAYIRVSTVKQGERGSSLVEQRTAIEQFALRQQLTIVAWFEERETAAKQGRPNFSRMLAQLSNGAADGVIIHKIDRGARNLRDWANLGDLIDRGVDVLFAHDNVDLQSRGGRLSADIQAVVAADYIRNLREEVKKGFYGRLKQGLYPLPAPVGYLDRGKGQPKELDPVSAPLIQQAFELYDGGRMSLRGLRHELERRGLRSARGKYLTIGAVSRILHNPFYMGVIQIARTNETFAGVHKPIVSAALFERVQGRLSGKWTCTKVRHEFPFRRFIRCATCEYHLVATRKKGRYVYYHCCKKYGHAVIRENSIHEEYEQLFGLIRLTSEEVQDVRDIAEEYLRDGRARIEAGDNALQMQLGKCDERLVRLTDALLDGLIQKDLFELRRSALLRDRQSILNALADPRNHRSAGEIVLSYLELRNIKYSGYKIANPGEKRRIAEAVTWNFSVREKKPVITLKSPYREIVQWRKSHQGEPHADTGGTRHRELFEILLAAAQEEAINIRPNDSEHHRAAVRP